ncbi:hypothetical protein AB1N83_001785 [Pleurotus pulmonarius]|nr:hypothetical protein EYR36_008653 [Pleurotus pulmonarius]
MQFTAAILATAVALAASSTAAPVPLDARAEANADSSNAPAKDDLLYHPGYGYRYRYGWNRWRLPSVPVSVPVVRPVEVTVISDAETPGAETVVTGVV